MIIVEQLRSARTALRWSIEELAGRSSVSVRTIKMVEANDGIPQCKTATTEKLVSALQSAGIEFIGSPDDGPGIRIRRPKEPLKSVVLD